MKTRKLLCVLLSLTMLFSMTAFATGTDEASPIVELLLPMYDGKISEYVILSKTGANITEQFYNMTAPYFQTGDYSEIYHEYQNAVSLITRSQTTYSRTRSLDVSKRQTTTFGGTVYAISGSDGYENVARDYVFEYYGTIYYNENTGLISSAVGPYINQSMSSVSPGENAYTTVSPSGYSIAANRQSATFTLAVHITFSYLLYINYDFGVVSDQMVIRP